MSSTQTYFYQDKPLFGLDIGYSSIKVMQLQPGDPKATVLGYGVTDFDAAAIKDGVIVDMEILARAIHDLFDRQIVGSISSRRVAAVVPVVRSFNRNMTLPKLEAKDLDEAVKLEAEQYIPVPIDELYTDYEIIDRSDKGTELLMVAIPKKIVDSYVALSHILGLELVSLETTIGATSRLFVQAERSDVPTVLIDFGSISADISIYHKALVVTGTVPCGGDDFTEVIAQDLQVSKSEAQIIKTKYGLSPSKRQPEIRKALAAPLELMLKEIRRMVRYYEERNESKMHIGQVVTMGGGANMPGLSDFLTNELRIPVRMCDPWQHLDFGGLQPPGSIEKSMYVTVAGSALLNPKEIYS